MSYEDTIPVVNEFLKAFPEAAEKAQESKDSWSIDGEILTTVFFGQVVTNLVIDALHATNKPLLSRLSVFFETMASSPVEDIVELLATGTLEVLGDDKKLLKQARKWMGKKSLALSHVTECHLGRE